MKVINYRVTLLEPTLVTALQGDPNSAVAFDYLPGSVLRGIMIGKYLKSRAADASDGKLQRLFFDGTTRYLNAYPLDVYDRPGLPVPASWQQVKDNEGEIFDFAIEPQDDRQQWQLVTVPFYTQLGEDVWLIRPARNVAVHTQRTARFGRAYRPTSSNQAGSSSVSLLDADEIVGAVYRYDALAAEQTFQAAIICDHDADEQTLRDFISGRVTLGGARSGGYGRSEINLITNDNPNDETPVDAEDGPEGKLIVTLHSDVLLRDARGQFAVNPELLRQVLGKHLGVELELENAFLGAKPIGGFNRKWGLPLPQALSVSMGSVLIFKDPDCDHTLLDDLEARGIGERRAEGFGRIVFNQQRAIKLVVTENTRKSPGPAVSIISHTAAGDLARLMVNRMLKQRLDEGLLVAANRVTITNPPSNAQLSRLRGIVLEEFRKALPDIGKIHQFIKGIQARGSSRRQFERSIVNNNEPLLHWLERLLKYDSTGVWAMTDNDWNALLRLNEVKVNIGLGDVEAEINATLRLKYILRFIDLVLAHAVKQRGRED